MHGFAVYQKLDSINSAAQFNLGGKILSAWGVGILSDDFASDIYGEYMERYDDGEEHSEIRVALEQGNQDALEDVDDGPVFWYALAKAQWECGVLEADVLQRVSSQIASKNGLGIWQDSDPATIRKRQAVLDKFLAQIQQPKPKPRKRRKVRHTPAIYQPGDCLSIALPDGDYGAALILAIDDSAREEDSNLVAVLKYKSPDKPSLPVFEQRQWLILTHHSWENAREIHWSGARRHKKEGQALELLGNIELRDDDPKKCYSYHGWNLGQQVMLQDKWDRGERD